jgi:hypothetical protein
MSSSDFSLNQADNTEALIFIAETFVDGQQRDVWCDSQTPITDMRMHSGGSQFKDQAGTFIKAASCYKVYHNSGKVGLILLGDDCLLNAMHSYYMVVFLCA